MKIDIPIYLISLKKDTKRRERLKENFIESFKDMQIIEAVDADNITSKEYFNHTIKYYKKYKRIMSPSELGCTLSHIKTLKTFLDTDHKTALILEDDIIGEDNNLDEIKNITSSLLENSLVILGGMDGLNKKNLLGKRADFNDQLLKIPRPLHRNLNRTCCYLLTRTSAKAILDSHNELLNIADKWDIFFSNTSIDIYYIKLLKHPTDTSESVIEKERNLANVKRIKFPIKELVRVGRRLVVLYYKLLGYEKV